MDTSKIAAEIATLIADNSASIERSRKNIAEAALDGSQASHISGMVNSLSHLTGFEFTMARIQMVLNHREGDIASVEQYMLDVAIHGADDTASGRNGDMARSYHEGVLEAIRRVRDAIRYS